MQYISTKDWTYSCLAKDKQFFCVQISLVIIIQTIFYCNKCSWIDIWDSRNLNFNETLPSKMNEYCALQENKKLNPQIQFWFLIELIALIGI